jgi:hypothetical protein
LVGQPFCDFTASYVDKMKLDVSVPLNLNIDSKGFSVTVGHH